MKLYRVPTAGEQQPEESGDLFPMSACLSALVIKKTN